MHVAKCAQERNPFIGLFGCTNDRFTLMAKNAQERFLEGCAVLKTTIVKVSVGGSNLIGIYAAMNSNGIVLPSFVEEEELKPIKELGLNIYCCRDRRNAMGNNIAANDKGGVINRRIESKERKRISDCLCVPLEGFAIAGHETVGSACTVTNKGFIAHNESTEREIERLESIFSVKGTIGTVNMGSPFPSIGLIANSNGYVVGETTSGFEIGRIEEGLQVGDWDGVI